MAGFSLVRGSALGAAKLPRGFAPADAAPNPLPPKALPNPLLPPEARLANGDALLAPPNLNFGGSVAFVSVGFVGEANEVNFGAPADPNPPAPDAPRDAKGDDAVASFPKAEELNALDEVCAASFFSAGLASSFVAVLVSVDSDFCKGSTVRSCTWKPN